MFCILAENLGEVVDLSTKTHIDSVAVILAEATQIVNRWCTTPLSPMVHLIKSVQQAVLMNPLAFTNMMHRTTIADQSGHGYHCVLLLNLMVLRLWLHWKIMQLPIYSRAKIWINSSNILVHPLLQHCLVRHKICSTKVLRNQHYGHLPRVDYNFDPTKLQDDWGVWARGYQTLKHSFVMAITRKCSLSIMQNALQLFSLMTKW